MWQVLTLQMHSNEAITAHKTSITVIDFSDTVDREFSQLNYFR